MGETGIPVRPELLGDEETPDEQRVAVAYCHYGSVAADFSSALMGLFNYDVHHGRHWDCMIQAKGAYIAMERNDLVTAFLRDRSAHWMLQLDNDVIFPEDTIERMLDLADPDVAPIVAALYLGPLQPYPGNREAIEYLPLWTHANEEGERYPVMSVDFSQDLMPIQTCGMGCTLIHRSVFERMEEAYGDDPWHWYAHDVIEGNRCGEDISFCCRARALGVPIWGAPNIRCGHIKSHVLHPLSYHDQRPTQIVTPASV